MGQQQLLLVILVTIIVGIATVVAINIFGTSAENANADSVRVDLTSLATAAEGWYIKPVMLGGGGSTYTELSFDRLTFPLDGQVAAGDLAGTNLNARYIIAPQGQQFEVTAHPRTSPWTFTMTVTRTNNRPVVAIVENIGTASDYVEPVPVVVPD